MTTRRRDHAATRRIRAAGKDFPHAEIRDAGRRCHTAPPTRRTAAFAARVQANSAVFAQSARESPALA